MRFHHPLESVVLPLTFDPVRAALIGGWTIRRAAEVLPHKWRIL